MRNPELPKLLRARRDVMQSEGLQVIYDQSAVELEKLEKIYKIIDNASFADCATKPHIIFAAILGALDD